MSATPEAMIRHVPDIQIENPEFATITTVRGSERMTARFFTQYSQEVRRMADARTTSWIGASLDVKQPFERRA